MGFAMNINYSLTQSNKPACMLKSFQVTIRPSIDEPDFEPSWFETVAKSHNLTRLEQINTFEMIL